MHSVNYFELRSTAKYLVPRKKQQVQWAPGSTLGWHITFAVISSLLWVGRWKEIYYTEALACSVW